MFGFFSEYRNMVGATKYKLSIVGLYRVIHANIGTILPTAAINDLGVASTRKQTLQLRRTYADQVAKSKNKRKGADLAASLHPNFRDDSGESSNYRSDPSYVFSQTIAGSAEPTIAEMQRTANQTRVGGREGAAEAERKRKLQQICILLALQLFNVSAHSACPCSCVWRCAGACV